MVRSVLHPLVLKCYPLRVTLDAPLGISGEAAKVGRRAQTKTPIQTRTRKQIEALRLIDFEYACAAPRAFDVANFFLECGFEEESEAWDWAAVPRRGAKLSFATAYAQTWNAARDIHAGGEPPSRFFFCLVKRSLFSFAKSMF